ncbi:VPLPA-CTERM sorting domain-containing protein [Pikeienuella piscinae]|uniref:VPLPA-CTERM sorting domain-containing protein n=1 Tax=Pikeienuella piscinae TaxID=2748098 RepID=A0A7L5C0D0_9RHOB|nr:VPLPA-CTERM sorting domain-containing protein [Pikeienuella piscinae]QIE55976.1 VPLPA-CTERM sorting domain-containing protein [Pikeienuella piscinae]
MNYFYVSLGKVGKVATWIGGPVVVAVVVMLKMGPTMKIKFCAALAAGALLSSGAEAATLKLDGYTAGVKNVTVSASPVANTPNPAGATGFNISDQSGSLGSFVAWCLDIGHYLMGVGDTDEYDLTTDPFSNSFGLTQVARDRVQAVFDANYGTLDASDSAQATGFQMALWEAAFEDDATAMSMSDGAFIASNAASDSLASTYLANAIAHTGSSRYQMSFFEISSLDENRGRYTGQNLVTVSEVPLPAAGLLLLTALGGTAFVGRRRKS